LFIVHALSPLLRGAAAPVGSVQVISSGSRSVSVRIPDEAGQAFQYEAGHLFRSEASLERHAII
jgi:hypothetical protein